LRVTEHSQSGTLATLNETVYQLLQDWVARSEELSIGGASNRALERYA
jgi:hypothetical protein